MTKFRLANPCQNKESKQNMTKETKEMLMNVFSTRPFVLKCGRPRKSLNSYSAQINFDITI